MRATVRKLVIEPLETRFAMSDVPLQTNPIKIDGVIDPHITFAPLDSLDLSTYQYLKLQPGTLAGQPVLARLSIKSSDGKDLAASGWLDLRDPHLSAQGLKIPAGLPSGASAILETVQIGSDGQVVPEDVPLGLDKIGTLLATDSVPSEDIPSDSITFPFGLPDTTKPLGPPNIDQTKVDQGLDALQFYLPAVSAPGGGTYMYRPVFFTRVTDAQGTHLQELGGGPIASAPADFLNGSPSLVIPAGATDVAVEAFLVNGGINSSSLPHGPVSFSAQYVAPTDAKNLEPLTTEELAPIQNADGSISTTDLSAPIVPGFT